MAGNSQRKGAVRKRGKGIGPTGRTAGSGGRVKRGLEGKGPTPKAEDRPYHKAYRKRRPEESPISGNKPRGRRTPPGEQRVRQGAAKAPGADWVIGRNPVLEALQADLPVRREYEYAHPGDLLEDALADDDAPIVVACDQVTDPRNLGAIIRSAAAFGAVGVIVPERRSAHMTAAAWKTSAGAAVRVPVALATNLNRVLRDYAEAGFVVVGLAGEGEVDIAEIPGVDGPVLLVVGSEGEGLSQLVRKNCDVLASIPIASEVESLNASVAASIALYEVARSR